MKKCILGYVLALVLFLSVNTEAQETGSMRYQQYVQDVFQSELVYPQEKNEFQFTLLPQFEHASELNSFTVPFAVEFGLTNSWQISAGINSFRHIVPYSGPSVNGTGDIQVGTQYSFMNIGNSNFHAVVGFELGIPFRKENNDYSNNVVSYEPYLSLAIDLPQFHKINLFAMTGVEFFNRDSKTQESEPAEFNLNGGLLFPYKFMVFTSEISFGTNKLNGGDEIELYYTPGLIFNLPGGWEAGLGIPVGLNEQSGNSGIIGMLIFEFDASGKDD